MYNPCQLLTKELVLELVDSGNRYFVQQCYPRGDQYQPEKKGVILTHYVYYESAMHHFDALKNDLIRIVYDAYDLVQRSLLMAAAAQPEGLAVYSSVFMFRSWEPPKDLSYKMKRYLNKKTKFRFTSGLDVTPYMHLGEMYIRFTKGLETTKIQLAELERI